MTPDADASCEQFIELLALEAHPDQTLHAVLFENVNNAKQLRAQLDAGELPCSAALINACAVPHLSLLQSAAHKALHSKATAALHTKNLHTELVYNLSSSKHIGESLRRFGVGDDSRSLLLACFGTSKERVAALGTCVQGQPAPLTRLATLADLDTLKRWYKLTDKELALPGGLVDAVLTRIALREAEK
ncbi:kinase binding protein CGI-121-domain-containing protein [Haematococcus lacustris]